MLSARQLHIGEETVLLVLALAAVERQALVQDMGFQGVVSGSQAAHKALEPVKIGPR